MKRILFAFTLFTAPFLTFAQCTVTLQQTDTIFCNGLCTGGLSASVAGGLAPYTYSWSHNSNTDTSATGLCAGTYTVTTMDDNGCIASDTYVITQPQPLSLNAIVLGANCSGNCDGDITMTVSGGTTPYTYSWVFGDVTKDLHGICPGTYCETISDTNGCTLDTCFNVTEPSPVSIGKNVGNVSCPGAADGYISLDISGGKAPLKYFWFSTSDSTNVSDSLVAGTYCVQVTDSSGCGDNACIEVTEPLPYSVTADIIPPTCYGDTNGCFTMTVSGGTAPYTYLWNSGATTKDLCPVSATFYSVHITDTMGCKKDTSFIMNEPMLLDVTLSGTNTTCIGCNDGAINASPSGGTAPYTYTWNPNISSGSSASGLPAGTYTVCVMDSGGCSSCDTIAIFEDPTFIKNVTDLSWKIYPNPSKGEFTVSGLQFALRGSLELFNIFGQNVFSTQLQTINNKLQTSVNISSFSKGIYFVKLISDTGELIGMKKIIIE